MHRFFSGCAAVLFLSNAFAIANDGVDDGIFADFETSMGSFTCKLHDVESPWAVANFIGLAEGTRPWIDPATGAVCSGVPFYDGLTFHRVIDGFMNQSGSRNGMGNDGPGYVFRDETDNGLVHEGPGVLSMANAGPQTNGAQFFVTVDDARHLDGKHTVFGIVTAGLDVVQAINTAPKMPGNSERLADPVMIHRVTIRRHGSAAEAFDIHAQGLPVCAGTSGGLDVVKDVSATFLADPPISASTVLQVWRSTNLKTWNRLGQIYRGVDGDSYIDVGLSPATAPREFFHVSTTHYPVAYAPESYANRTLRFEWNGGSESLTYQFDATGFSGNAVLVNPGQTTNHAFEVEDFLYAPFTAGWIFIHDGLQDLLIQSVLLDQSATHTMGSADISLWNEFQWQRIIEGDVSITRDPVAGGG